MKNKYDSFIPLMHEHEYEFIEKYLNSDDTLLEFGAGQSTIYFSGIVKKVISIEHDIDWINKINDTIKAYDIKNINLHYVKYNLPEPIPCRYEQFKDYIEFAKKKKFKFTKVLIDGRARKYCAKSIWNVIDENIIVFIHDFNRPDYQKTLKYYDIIEQSEKGQGIVALRKKIDVIKDDNYY